MTAHAIETLIDRLVAKFAASAGYYTDPRGTYKESDTRSEFIDPFLGALGWDISNAHGIAPHLKDVVREESQEQEDAAVKYPDYTLRIAGSRRLFIEAKKPSVDVTSHMESIRQARRYGYTGADPIVVLTNFRDLVVYDATIGIDPADPPHTGRIYHWHYTEYTRNIEEIRKVLGRGEVAVADWSTQFRATAAQQPVPAGEEFIRQFNRWRLALGLDLLTQDNAITQEDLNDAVQRVLNRLIFVRMCEDRGIEGQRTLRDAVHSSTTIASLLNRLHRRYNTGFFDAASSPLATKVSNSVLQNIVANLYAPHSPFSFAVLDSKFLGLVYEASLAEHLTIEGSQVTLRKKREYEHREVVTTPQSLVDETVSAALKALPAAAGAPKTLDFAVGSGRFLLSVFDRLLEAETERQIAAGSSTLVKVGQDEFRLAFAQKRQILEENLFGIDIDYNAVEVAKFSLLVRLLEDETRHTLPPATDSSILPDLNKNIIWGNTLVRSLPAGTSEEQLSLTRPLELGVTSLPAEFDLCVGNPPYMAPERMKRFDAIEYRYLEDNFETAFQQFDKYFTFIEFAANHLRQGGVLGVVVPNKWMTVVAGQKLRNLLRSTIQLVRLDNFREAQLFPDKSIYVCNLIARKAGPGPFLYAEPCDLEAYVAGKGAGYVISPTQLPASASGAWVLPTNGFEDAALRAVIANSIPLDEIVAARNGIQTSAERSERYLVTNPTRVGGGLLQWVDKYGVVNEIESALTRPFLKDSKLVRSHHEVRPDRLIIFPYQESAASPSGWEVIPPATMRLNFPKAHAYFISHKSELDRRKMSPNERRKAFYSYGRTQAIPYAALAPKILYSTNQRGQKYGIDETGIVYASGGTAGEVALYPIGSPYSLDFVLGLLDHPVIEFFLRKRGSVFRGGYYARGTDVIGEAPVPKLDFANARDKRFHDDVTSSVQALRALHAATPTVSQRGMAQHVASIGLARDSIRELFNQRWGISWADVRALGID